MGDHVILQRGDQSFAVPLHHEQKRNLTLYFEVGESQSGDFES